MLKREVCSNGIFQTFGVWFFFSYLFLYEIFQRHPCWTGLLCKLIQMNNVENLTFYLFFPRSRRPISIAAKLSQQFMRGAWNGLSTFAINLRESNTWMTGRDDCFYYLGWCFGFCNDVTRVLKWIVSSVSWQCQSLKQTSKEFKSLCFLLYHFYSPPFSLRDSEQEGQRYKCWRLALETAAVFRKQFRHCKCFLYIRIREMCHVCVCCVFF